MTARAFIATTALWAGLGPALAGKLPATAVPLNAGEVTKLHAGNTGLYPTVEEYFAPDGTTTGVFGRPVPKSIFAGRWIVVGNTLCTLNGNKFTPTVYVDCNSFWKEGDKIFLLWSTHSDGSKPDIKNGYFDTAGTIAAGNVVAEKYKALGGN